jgi:hypothetical protein
MKNLISFSKKSSSELRYLILANSFSSFLFATLMFLVPVLSSSFSFLDVFKGKDVCFKREVLTKAEPAFG